MRCATCGRALRHGATVRTARIGGREVVTHGSCVAGADPEPVTEVAARGPLVACPVDGGRLDVQAEAPSVAYLRCAVCDRLVRAVDEQEGML